MSGVFGFWNLDGQPADPDLLGGMAAALAHRGPDGWDGWCEGDFALGHRLLRTTPEARGEHQPLLSRDGRYVLAADLRLDNRAELIRQLGMSRAAAVDVPDAELALGMFAAQGAAAAERLLGDFAVVVRDTRRRELVLVRDHFGVKPLYYCHVPGRLFAFASEVKALFELPGVEDDVDELHVARHLMLPVADDAAATYYRAVRRALPAHVLTVTRDGVREKSYWSLDPERTPVPGSDGEYAEAVRDAFTEAVRCRLRSAGPVAAMLSGGIDSSSVTCVAARLLGDAGGARLRTLSAVYPDVPASDERRYIEAVRQACGVDTAFFEADRVSPLASAELLNWHGDGANWAGNLYLNHELYRTASAGGARVVLDGFDGDSTISHGSGWLVELALAGRWWRLARETKSLADNLGEPWGGVFRSWVTQYGVRPALRRLPGRALRRRLGAVIRGGTAAPPPGATAEAALPPWGRFLAADYRQRLASQVVAAEPPPRTEREHHRRLISRPLLLHMLGWAEATGAGAGVEVRFPFFDVRLVELCVSLPGEQKLRGGWSRFVMRNAMAGILPDSIRWRRDKGNLEPGFYHALRVHAGGQLGALAAAEGELCRFISPGALAELHRGFMAGTLEAPQVLKYWRMSSLAFWLTTGRKVRRSSGDLSAGEAAERVRLCDTAPSSRESRGAHGSQNGDGARLVNSAGQVVFCEHTHPIRR